MVSAEPSALQPALEAPPTAVLGRARGRHRARELPAAAVLALVVGASAALRFALAAAVPGPGIFPDEIIYSELARSISSGDFLVRDAPFAAWTFGPLYALLVAPAFLISSLPDAYLAAKATNCLVMSLAAVPTYFLARRVVDDRLARVSAALAVLLPAMAYSSRVMTESAFYPLFLCFVLAAVRMLERPTPARQWVALATIAIACAVRPQALVLVPVLLTAVVVHSAPSRRATLSAYRTMALSLLAFVGVAGFGAIAAGSPASSLAERAADIATGVAILDVPQWLLYHVAELDLALGVIPFAGAVLFLRRSLRHDAADARARALAVLTVAATAWTILLAAAFASQPDVGRIQERYVFYVGPLLLIAFLGWIGSGAGRGAHETVLVASLALLPLVLPFGSLLNYHAYASTPGLVPWLALRDVVGLDATFAVAAGLGIAAVAVFVRVREATSLVLPALAYLLISTLLVAAAFRAVSARSLAAGVGAAGDRAWVDRAVGEGAEVAVLWSAKSPPPARYREVWETEFFNRSVGPVYYLYRPLPYELPETRVRPSGGALLLPDGRPLRAAFVLSDGPRIVGERMATRPDVGLTLYRVRGVVQLEDTEA